MQSTDAPNPYNASATHHLYNPQLFSIHAMQVQLITYTTDSCFQSTQCKCNPSLIQSTAVLNPCKCKCNSSLIQSTVVLNPTITHNLHRSHVLDPYHPGETHHLYNPQLSSIYRIEIYLILCTIQRCPTSIQSRYLIIYTVT